MYTIQEGLNKLVIYKDQYTTLPFMRGYLQKAEVNVSFYFNFTQITEFDTYTIFEFVNSEVEDNLLGYLNLIKIGGEWNFILQNSTDGIIWNNTFQNQFTVNV